MNKKIIPIVILIIVIGLGTGAYFVLSNREDTTNTNNTNQNNSPLNQNQDVNTNSEPTNENTNQTNAVTSGEVTMEGMVFLAAYDTPSESYGISTSEGIEIGLGKYDSMKEQFRQYIGEKVKVTFEKICRSNSTDCCRSVILYCGTVKSWVPLEK